MGLKKNCSNFQIKTNSLKIYCQKSSNKIKNRLFGFH
jgi:hypothetical protein